MAAKTTSAALRSPPGPRSFLGIRTSRTLKRDPLKILQDFHRAYGEIVHYSLLSAPIYFLSHPDHVGYVLHKNERNYGRSRDHETLKRLLGNGLLTNDGASWLKQRRLIQPGFHRSRIVHFGEIMTEETEKMLEKWKTEAPSGEPLDVSSEMMRLTLAIISRTMFGATVSRDAVQLEPAITLAQEEARGRMYTLVDLPEWVPLPGIRRAVLARQTIERVVMRIVDERRRTNALDQDDLLSMLLNARDADSGEPMDDNQLRDEVRTIFLAGHETTANALTWTWYLLARNPAAAKKLRAELAHVLCGRLPTVADLPQLPYTKMVVEESMRLLPPVWALSRKAIADDEIGGYHIRSGGTVIVSQFITHRRPDFWEDPESFDPERFAPERVKERHRFAYFPFGGGQRICIGRSFAIIEAQLILATIAQQYELNLVADHPIELEPLVTLRPKFGMMMTLNPCASIDERNSGHAQRTG